MVTDWCGSQRLLAFMMHAVAVQSIVVNWFLQAAQALLPCRFASHFTPRSQRQRFSLSLVHCHHLYISVKHLEGLLVLSLLCMPL